MPRMKPGFTLIEILLVVVIISALAAMVIPRLTGRSEQAKQAIAKADIVANIPTALKLYELDNGMYPSTEQGIKALTEKPKTAPMPQNWNGPYVESKSIVDPWGRDYLYRYPSTHGIDYDLSSLGRDGKEDDTDVCNWK